MRFSSVCAWALAGLAALVVGCSGPGDKKIDYYGRQARPPLSLPADLTRPATDADMSAAVADAAGPQGTSAGKGSLNEAPPALSLAKAQLDADRGVLTVHDDLRRAWRSVGLALDRAGFVVEDRDREKGLYYVRYNDGRIGDAKPGRWSRWFAAKAPATDHPAYQVRLEPAGDDTAVRVLDAKGVVLSGDAARPLLDALYQQLE